MRADTVDRRLATIPDFGKCAECKRRGSLGTPRRDRNAGTRTMRKHRLHRLQLRASERSQRPYRLRIWRLTSSQLTTASGCFFRFSVRRSNSAFCQSWIGTSAGVAARSSQRSSTNCSFSAGVNSKTDRISALTRAPQIGLCRRLATLCPLYRHLRQWRTAIGRNDRLAVRGICPNFNILLLPFQRQGRALQSSAGPSRSSFAARWPRR